MADRAFLSKPIYRSNNWIITNCLLVTHRDDIKVFVETPFDIKLC